MSDQLLLSSEGTARLTAALRDVVDALVPPRLAAGPDFGAPDAVQVADGTVDAVDRLVEQLRGDAEDLAGAVDRIDRVLSAVDRFLADRLDGS